MHSIKQEIRATGPVSPEIPTSVFVISLHCLVFGQHDSKVLLCPLTADVHQTSRSRAELCQGAQPVCELDCLKRLPRQSVGLKCSGILIGWYFCGTVTPLDVVKIRLQTQQKPAPKGSCLLYYNGLMDHICPVHGNGNGHNGSGIQPSTR